MEQTVHVILDICTLYPDNDLTDLYDKLTILSELHKTHQQNNKEVMKAYEFSIEDMTESK